MSIKSFDTELTQEEVEDFISGLLSGGDKINLVYDDSGDTLTINTSAQDTEEVQDIVGSMLKEGTAISLTYDDSNGELTVEVDQSSLSLGSLGSRSHGELTDVDPGDHHTRYSNEEAQDTVANMLTAGAAISLNYDDSGNSLTITADVSSIRTDTGTAFSFETRTGDPSSPSTGRAWLRTDL